MKLFTKRAAVGALAGASLIATLTGVTLTAQAGPGCPGGQCGGAPAVTRHPAPPSAGEFNPSDWQEWQKWLEHMAGGHGAGSCGQMPPMPTRWPAPGQDGPSVPKPTRWPAPPGGCPGMPGNPGQDPGDDGEGQEPGAPAPTRDPEPGQNPGAPAPTRPADPGQNPGAPAPTRPADPGQNPGAPAPTRPADPGQNPGAPAPTRPADPGQNPGAPAPTRPADQPGAPVTDEDKIEAEIHRLVNEERGKHGLPPLTRNTKADEVAANWSKKMGDTGQFYHNPKMDQELKSESNYIGENIAMSSARRTPEDAGKEFVTMWMNSTGHRDNILNRKFTFEGVGVVKAPNGSLYATQNLGTGNR